MGENAPLERNLSPSSAASPRVPRWVLWASAGVVVAAAGVVLLWWRPHAQPPANLVASHDDDSDGPAPADPGYIGPRACAACHAKRVAEFEKTNHARTCREPQSGTMPAGFARGKGTYVVHGASLRFEMTQERGKFLQTTSRTTPNGVERSSAPIDLVFGAGATDEVYLTWRGDRLYELPIVWLQPQQQWAASPLDPRGKGDLSREMTPRCLECHNTWFEHAPGTANQYNRATCIVGVTCERCHGPGRDHVSFHQAHPEVRTAHAVVHPGRLTRERQLDVCGQCHSNAVQRRGPAFSYRPGNPLEAYFRTAASKHPEDDHVANQVKYLRQSKCFQKDERLTCTSCHNPHRPAGPANAGAASCRKCHEPAECHEQERLPAAVRGDCVGCHMPQRYKIQVSFDTEDDHYVPPVRSYEHRIGIYPWARQQVLLEWCRTRSDADSRREAARLKDEVVKHWIEEADKCGREYRFLAATAALREALRFDSRPALRERLHEMASVQATIEADMLDALHQIEDQRYTEAIETLKKVLRAKPDLGTAHGKLGTLYAVAGERDRAVEHLRAVARYDPDNAYGYSMLGWLAYLDGKSEAALEAYRRAEEIEPYDAKINYHMGLALMNLGRVPEAAERFRRALAIDPNHAAACHSLSQALRQQGQPNEAVRFARRAARLTRFQDPDVLLALAESYTEAGRLADADATAVQALEAAQKGDPERVPQMRRRVEAIRARARGSK
jgi:tetratricopeptide (TPR) repeat protein